jgi:hypothetical protein
MGDIESLRLDLSQEFRLGLGRGRSGAPKLSGSVLQIERDSG